MRARDNPFSTDRILRVRYRLEGITWEALLDRLAALSFRAAVTGPHGAGKTTLLEDLEEKLRARGFAPRFVGLNSSSVFREKRALLRMVTSLGPNDFLILDGAEQLNLVEWMGVRWLSRRAGGILISLHRPSRLPTLWHCVTHSRLLEKVVDELAPGLLAESGPRDFHALFEKHRGNLREALRELYDEFSTNPARLPWRGE